MAGEQERTASGPGNFQCEQMNAPTRPGRPEQAAESMQQHYTPLFLPGQGTLPVSAYTEDTHAFHVLPPVPAHPQSSTAYAAPVVTRQLTPAVTAIAVEPPQSPDAATRRSRLLLWLGAGLTCLALLALASGILFALVVPREHARQEPQATQSQAPAVVQATPTPTSTVGNTPVSANGFTVVPAGFTSANCVVDNGYRCTALLSAPLSQQTTVNWTAYGTGVATKFSPASGTISPGQQQQIIVYIYTPCPNSGQFVFLLDNASLKLEAPWTC